MGKKRRMASKRSILSIFIPPAYQFVLLCCWSHLFYGHRTFLLEPFILGREAHSLS